jgi:hypothetical protein
VDFVRSPQLRLSGNSLVIQTSYFTFNCAAHNFCELTMVIWFEETLDSAFAAARLGQQTDYGVGGWMGSEADGIKCSGVDQFPNSRRTSQMRQPSGWRVALSAGHLYTAHRPCPHRHHT